VALVEGIVAMASAMGMRVIGEGIEVPEAVTMLAAMGCELGQGFLYSPAVTLQEALGLAAAGRIVPALGPQVALAT
jgi:EAL domain-containing protein (putative c-di-GMP-specific phosphodiesterase class I)